MKQGIARRNDLPSPADIILMVQPPSEWFWSGTGDSLVVAVSTTSHGLATWPRRQWAWPLNFASIFSMGCPIPLVFYGNEFVNKWCFSSQCIDIQVAQFVIRQYTFQWIYQKITLFPANKLYYSGKKTRFSISMLLTSLLCQLSKAAACA